MPDDRKQDGKTQTRDTSHPEVTQPAAMPDPRLDPALLTLLQEAAISDSRDSGAIAVRTMAASGIPAEDIADIYIPAAARELGKDWCADKVGFATVTIGVSRLQSMLRELGPVWAGDDTAPANAPTILLVVGYDVFHTLGAVVLAGQLRRKGNSVRLLLGATPSEAAVRAARGGYDAVFISASCGEKLENLRKTVESIQQEQTDPPPIVIGGTILNVADDIAALTGATLATCDPDEALKSCGLDERRTKPQGQPATVSRMTPQKGSLT